MITTKEFGCVKGMFLIEDVTNNKTHIFSCILCKMHLSYYFHLVLQNKFTSEKLKMSKSSKIYKICKHPQFYNFWNFKNPELKVS